MPVHIESKKVFIYHQPGFEEDGEENHVFTKSTCATEVATITMQITTLNQNNLDFVDDMPTIMNGKKGIKYSLRFCLSSFV